jgi:hypothetical protein
MKKLLLVAFLFSSMTNTLAQGKLGQAKKNISEPAPSKTAPSARSNQRESSRSSKTTNSNSASSNGGFFVELLSIATVGLLIGEVEPRSFHAHPYAEGENGEYIRSDESALGRQNNFMLSNTVITESETYGNDFKLNYRFIPFLGVEANHLYLWDRNVENSNLGVTGFMMNFYRVRENKVSAYWGLGGTHLGGSVSATGFSYNLGMDIYVANPISLGFYWKQTFVEDSITMNEFRLLARYHVNKLSFHAGFIHYKIGGVNFPSGAFGVDFRF